MKLVQVTAHRAAALALAAVAGLALGTARLADAQTFTVLYSFAGYPTDGAGPEAGLLMDVSGNLYGTTTFGGNVNSAHCGGSGYIGCGTVFELDTNGGETVLHNFAGPNGATPRANLIMDAKGGLYGTTVAGGTGCVGETFEGCGLVFKLSGGKETVLHYFTGGKDGKWPMAGIIADASGALYGTTYLGGKLNDGAVFKLVGTKEIVLRSFTGGKDGITDSGVAHGHQREPLRHSHLRRGHQLRLPVSLRSGVRARWHKGDCAARLQGISGWKHPSRSPIHGC